MSRAKRNEMTPRQAGMALLLTLLFGLAFAAGQKAARPADVVDVPAVSEAGG